MPALHRLPAVELARSYAARTASPVDVLDACLAQLDRVNPQLNAVIAQDRGGAHAAAEASARRWAAGTPASALDGVPFSVKDNIAVAGLPTTWGSALYRDFVPPVDELPVARLRQAGLVLLGKTNVPELTLQGYTDNALFGPTRNPWDVRLTPGGSSGGAVAAVAAGIGPLALGTDGGGSTRRPASHAGLVGLKPSPGRVPRCDGLPAILLDFEVIGPIARTVADVAALTGLLSAADPRDPPSLALPAWDVPAVIPRQRIRFVPRFGSHPVDPEIAASVAAAARALAALGHAVEEAEAPFDIEAVATIQATVGQAGLAWLMRDLGGTPTLPALQEMAASGAAMPAATLFGVLEAIAALRRTMAVRFAGCDLLLTPSAAALPWPATESHPPAIAGQAVGPRGHAVFTAFANIAGLPGISLPCAPSAAGLPIGFQLVGPRGADATLLAVAAAYEAACPWADRWPSLA